MLYSLHDRAADLVDLKGLLAELENASDRSAAIVAAACLYIKPVPVSLRAGTNFPKQFNMICVVPSLRGKYSA
jgi:hypothetical protein